MLQISELLESSANVWDLVQMGEAVCSLGVSAAVRSLNELPRDDLHPKRKEMPSTGKSEPLAACSMALRTSKLECKLSSAAVEILLMVCFPFGTVSEVAW